MSSDYNIKLRIYISPVYFQPSTVLFAVWSDVHATEIQG
jgi:hypothetical protein